LYLLLFKRQVFLNKHLWLSILVCLILLTPLIIYNFEVYTFRGHFDAALSSMLGLNPADYATLSYRSIKGGLVENFTNIFVAIGRNSSILFNLLFILSLVYFIWLVIRKRASIPATIIGLNLLMLGLMLLFAGAADRFVVISIPFLAIIVGLAANDWVKVNKPVAAVLLVMAVACEFAFAVNTNVLVNPVGKPPLAYAAQRFNVDGFENLDRYLKKTVYGTLGTPRRPNTLSGEDAWLDIKGREVVLFDERADWFSRVWYIDRYTHYYGIPIIYFTDLDKVVGERSAGQTDFLEYLRKGGAVGFWFVLAQGPAVSQGADPDYSLFMDNLQTQLEEAQTLTKEIKDGSGVTVFKIYHVK
jgi:hypothetical protein